MAARRKKIRPGPPVPSAGAMAAADRLHSAALHLLRSLRVHDRASGLGPARLSALSVLAFAGPRSPGQLAEAEQVRPPTMSRIASGLVRSGLARRTVRGSDRRSHLLETTAKGKRVMREARERRVASLAEALASLPPGKVRALHSFSDLVESIASRVGADRSEKAR
jgi:DNA-binding MarR family transcriptional regulator